LRSEVEAAAEQVRQAQAQLAQQRVAVQQANNPWRNPRPTATTADRAESRSHATGALAALLDRNFISRAEYDQVQTQYRVTEQRVAAAQKVVEVAQANVQAAQQSPGGAAHVKALEARLRTVQTGPPAGNRSGTSTRRRSRARLRVARQQVQEAVVTAPFAGIIRRSMLNSVSQWGLKGWCDW